MKDLNKKNLKEFIENYIDLDTTQQKTVEKFIMCKSQYHSVQKMENNNVQKIELRIRNV
jgi:uncharacterized ubiquitin-like protein YukD